MGIADLSLKIGEVVEADSSSFVAQSYELYDAPVLGSLVRTRCQDIDIYAVVYLATTAAAEPGRRPLARGRDAEVEADIFRDNPQLSRLLLTHFSALVLGHCQEGRVCHYLPPQPARVHGFVWACAAEEVALFSQGLDFLHLLLQARLEGSVEELVAACLRHMAQLQPEPRRFLVDAGRELARLLGGDFARLNAILKRIRP